MGKRKNASVSKDKSKKSKSDENSEHSENNDAVSAQPQNDEDSENRPKKATKPNLFDIKHFRKELTANQGQTIALTQFLQVCLNPDNDVDYMLEYLRAGGNPHEILRQISQDNKKNLTLATPAFHLFHLIILKVQSSLPHMIVITEEACRYFLNTFIPTLEIMISENAGPRHRKIILNLLTSMVTLSSDLGTEVLNQIPLTPKSLQHIVEKPNYKEKDNVRTAFVHFVTSFLVDGHLPLIKALLEKQGLVSLVIPGLIHDQEHAVLMFLNTLKKNVIDNTLISKTLKLKTFNHQVLLNLFKLFTWKGPPESNNAQSLEPRKEITTLLSEIMLTLFTSHKLGLYFLDNSLGTSEANKNPSLYKALQSLKRPWDNENQSEIVLEIIFRCPDLHRAIINVIEHSFQPQHSPIWEKVVEFVTILLDKLKPENMVLKMTHLTPVQTANLVRFVTMPVPLLRLINLGIGIDKTISFYCIKVLVKMLQTLKRYMQLLGLEETPDNILELRNKLVFFLPKHMPTQDTIISLMNDIINKNEEVGTSNDYRLPKPTTSDALLSLIEILLLNNYIYPGSLESLDGSLEIKKILDFCMTSDSVLLKYKAASVWQMVFTTELWFRTPMFKKLFLMTLEVYISEEDDIGIEAKDTLQSFFKSTNIYENDEDEVQLMLYTLRNSEINSRSSIAEVIVNVLENRKKLTDRVNQVVNSVFANNISQSNLDKLFSDLMHQKNKVGSAFLAIKIPSQFIVGCIHFINSNPDAKKTLKCFLNLYVANLLHWNYSPQLTGGLLGDFELDVRSYITDWISYPVAIPECITKDKTLQNISKSIIKNEDIPLTTMFPLIESSEEIDLNVMDVTYKIDQTNVINSTDLFVWAKYLIFCIVRLTNMGVLCTQQQNKIVIYFKTIIALGKKHHMLNVCRDIIGNLFRNAHVLKIYQPINFSKNESKVLATELLLEIIDQTQDIVNYLNKKDFILRSYQQKTFKEIRKAFKKIQKMKAVNSPLLVTVLDKIGLSAEDNLEVLDNIFDSNIEILCSKDREPTLLFDLLRILIKQYSKSTTLEISKNTLKNCMNLYFSLLTYKDSTPNLTKIEEPLIEYFENKPQRAIQISEEDFKKFFYASALRKSTSHLASVLLKYNNKLSNVFKAEIERAEVLSLREITLPLGNALTYHNQFLIDNKNVLKIIYEEYKPNIKKFIEKPHKAGQVYIQSSKLLVKLVIECMEARDCVNIFSKSHKFETVELSHVELLHAAFLKLCLFDELIRKEYLINYFSSIVNLSVMAMKESKTHILDVISKHTNIVIQITRSKYQLNEDEFTKITESSIWQNFCKCVLKDSLKVRTLHSDNITESKLLSLLTSLVRLFYPSDHEDIVNLFEMATSHSEFLNVMLSHHSPDIKLCLLEFLFALISKNKTVMKTQHIPVYLSSYHATRSSCDRLLLTILQFYENNDLPVNEYKPYIWGDTAADHYAVRKSRTSTLWGHPTFNQILNLLEKDKIKNTLNMFPVNQSLNQVYQLPNARSSDATVKTFLGKLIRDRTTKDMEAAAKKLVTIDDSFLILTIMQGREIITQSHLEEDETIYDPSFLLPLLSHLLAPGSVVSLFKLLRSGLFSVPVMGLSSHCSDMRAAAYHVLHRFYMLLETETKHKNDKLLLTDFIATLRQSLSTAINSPNGSELKNPKVSAIGALYLAKALLVCTSPTDPLYKPVNNFLIAKQFVDLTVVPDFLSLFHDSEVEAVERRDWILDIIKDGTKSMADVNVVFKTMCIKMIMAFYNTSIADGTTKLKILGVLTSMVAIPRADEILVEGYGIVSWLHIVARSLGKGDAAILKGLFVLIENMIHSMALNLFARHCSKFYAENRSQSAGLADFRVKHETEFEFLNIIYNLLPNVQYLVTEDIVDYVKLYNLITTRTIKFLHKKQMLNVVIKCSEPIKNINGVEFIRQALALNNCVILNSKTLAFDIVTIEDRLCSELKKLVNTYTNTNTN